MLVAPHETLFGNAPGRPESRIVGSRRADTRHIGTAILSAATIRPASAADVSTPAAGMPETGSAVPLRIALLAPAMPDYSVAFASAIADRAQVTMFAPARFFTGHAAFVPDNVDLRLLDWPRHRSPANLSFIPRLVRDIRAVRPDIVHFLSEGILWLALTLPFLGRRPIVTTLHDVTYHPGDHESRLVPRRFGDYLLGRSSRIIVHGEALRGDAERTYPALASRLAVLPHIQLDRYVEIAKRQGLRRSGGPSLRVLFFGRIFPYKGLDVLIRSIPAVAARHASIEVVIAGAGESMDNYRALIEEPARFNIRNRFVPDEETAQLFTDADIVVLPYLEASQSGVLAVANAFGKAVIVTGVGELGRSVEHERTGLVIPPGNVQALSAAILRLAQDPSLRNRLGAAGRLAAEQSTSAAAIARQAMTIYRSTRAY